MNFQANLSHIVSAAYDFNPSGAGKYTVHPRVNLYVVDSSGSVVIVAADTEDHVTKIAASSAKYSTRSTPKLSLIKKRSQGIGFNGCSADQQSIIQVAAPNAVTYIHASSGCVVLLVL